MWPTNLRSVTHFNQWAMLFIDQEKKTKQKINEQQKKTPQDFSK